MMDAVELNRAVAQAAEIYRDSHVNDAMPLGAPGAVVELARRTNLTRDEQIQVLQGLIRELDL